MEPPEVERRPVARQPDELPVGGEVVADEPLERSCRERRRVEDDRLVRRSRSNRRCASSRRRFQRSLLASAVDAS
ncbi:MAG: hypothetical protein AAGA99_17660 [Actinomycetota bacterium]